MESLKSIFIGTLVCLTTISCNNLDINSGKVEVTGTIQIQGITTYQYGTHTIAGYALRSNSITLDNYINQNITVVGKKIVGYPVDGGPNYIEVEKVK